MRRLTALVSPAELIGNRLAFVVPSGIANLLPWGSLDVRAPIVLLPTAGYLLDHHPEPPSDTVLVATGRKPLAQDGPGVPEARAVAALYGAEVTADGALSQSELRGRIGPGARLLHFTGPCRIDLRQPLRSGLDLLAPEREHLSALAREDPLGTSPGPAGRSERAREQQTVLLHPFTAGDEPVLLALNASGRAAPETDEQLTAVDLYGAPLPVQLAVYSRCDLDNSRFSDGDGVLTFARSHRLGGTRAVLHSLWEVDEATRQAFMTTFHFQSQRGNWAEAWLTARNTVRARGFPPGAVGAFILVGDARE